MCPSLSKSKGNQMLSSANILLSGIDLQSSNHCGVISSHPLITEKSALAAERLLLLLTTLLSSSPMPSSPWPRKSIRNRCTIISKASSSSNVKWIVPTAPLFIVSRSTDRFASSCNSRTAAAAGDASAGSTLPPKLLMRPFPKPRCFLPSNMRLRDGDCADVTMTSE